MRRALAATALALVATMAAPAAFGASGSMNDADDPTQDLADVLKLSYANKDAKAVMKMTYDTNRPDVENFYVKWGTGKYYQLQHSTNGTLLRYSDGSGLPSEESCSGDRVRFDADTLVSTGTIPRDCMSHAPAKVKFQGIVTAGTMIDDQTRTSDLVRKG